MYAWRVSVPALCTLETTHHCQFNTCKLSTFESSDKVFCRDIYQIWEWPSPHCSSIREKRWFSDSNDIPFCVRHVGCPVVDARKKAQKQRANRNKDLVEEAMLGVRAKHVGKPPGLTLLLRPSWRPRKQAKLFLRAS